MNTGHESFGNTLTFYKSYAHLDPEITGIQRNMYLQYGRTRAFPREISCQARDFRFSPSLTNEGGFSYVIFEAVDYDFKTIKLNQLVRSLLSCFDPNKFSVAVH
ncbi:hypothetical protein Bca52824_004839 [Brassica carinata]|uniref:Uncharacterized protein n=1 Tax=Brassica carinata TaxID=52824 RepID=A0A8X7WMD5_BRACI|nr:hypothetical protein Bca52824_004839 [Brassica carinata]